MSIVEYISVYSPLGIDLEENFNSISKGESGLKVSEDRYSYGRTFTSVVDESYLDNNFCRLGNPNYYTKLEKMSILVINDILDKTKINPNDSETLLIYSTTKGNIDIIDSTNDKIPKDRISLLEFLKVLKEFFSFFNQPLIVSNACVSGVQSILLAEKLLKNKKYKNIIVVGGDLVSRFTLSGFIALNAVSKEACRPFDLNRSGVNIGECCAGIVLTNQKSDKNVLLVTGASTVDANHIVAPSKQAVGLTKAIEKCLVDAGDLNLGFISSHGTATIYNDEMESLALANNNLGSVPLFSLKGYYGHTLGAAGILETIIGIEAMKRGCLIPSKGFKDNGVLSSINVNQNFIEHKTNSFLKTASGFGGVNAALIVKINERMYN